MAVTPTGASPVALILLQGLNQTDGPQSLDYVLTGVWTEVLLEVATTSTESRRGIWFKVSGGTVVRAERAAGVLTIKWKNAAGDYVAFTAGGSNDLNLIYSVTAASLVRLTLLQTGGRYQ